MNLDKIKPETLAAGVMDYMPSQSAVAHEYAERLNAALARLGLTDRLTLPPAPATAIDELPGVVDVPLRKTLSVLMGKAQQGDASALATLEWTAQVMESIFAGLHARASVYPLALPSHESLATLSQGVDALRDRKIGGIPQAPDGISLAQLLGSTSAVSAVTEIVDDNTGWVADQRGWLSTILNTFVNLQYAVINCDDMNVSPLIANTKTAAEIHIKTKALSFSQEDENNDMPNVDLWLDELETCNIRAQGQATFRSKSINMPKFKYGTYSIGGSAGWANGDTKRIYFGCKGVPTDTIILTNASSGSTGSTQALEIIELREGARQRFMLANIPSWDCYPNITAENIVTYILDRLADNSDGEPITITLGTYLLAKLSNEQIAIATNKNYTLA